MRGPVLVLSCLTACGPLGCSDAREAKRVELSMVTDGAGLETITTDLGYEVELSSARVVAADLQFTIAGEAHSSLWRRFSDAIVPLAHAHPGHYQGGEVTGELAGHFVLSFLPGEVREVGMATLIVGTYHSANLMFAQAGASEVEADDPLLGHTALLAGTASNGGSTFDFEITVDSPEARELVGIPFAETVTESSDEALSLRLLTRDPLENDTLFDGMDFALLDADGDGKVSIDPASTEAASVAAYNTFRRVFQTHDHFVVRSRH